MDETIDAGIGRDPEISFFDSAIKSGGVIDFQGDEPLRISRLLRSGWITRRDDGKYDVGPAAIRAVAEARIEASAKENKDRELNEIKDLIRPRTSE